MEDDTEVLDWGNEDDELQASESYRAALQQNGQDDAEDAVSLGGDEDDEIYPYKATSHEDSSRSQQSGLRRPQTPQQTPNGKRDLQRENSGTPQKSSSRQTDSSQLRRSQSLGQLTHALPPKPTFAAPPSPLATPATTSTLASAMVVRERRSNGHSKSVSGSRDRGSGLPPDWEERYPRGGGSNPYYYNVKTHESTWTRPLLVDSDSALPSKEWDSDSIRVGVDLSPRRGIVDDLSRSPKKEGRRRASPGGSLTYEDRHYRPDAGGTSNGLNAVVEKEDTYIPLPPRPVSPRGVDRRRDARSVTPPPSRRQARSVERASRVHRELSPPPAERLTSRRDVPDARQSPLQDRVWDRSRTSHLQEDTRGRDFPGEPNAARGRRPRDDALPEALRSDQDSHNAYNVWTAPRPRSPLPHVREPSPQRRYPEPEVLERDSRQQKPRYDRPQSPLPERPRVTDSYAPADSIPQRRARDYDPEYESDSKRRRVEDEPYRRRLSFERSPMLDRPPSQAALVEVPNARKRPPLPPQSEHFREISRGRPVTDVPPTSYPVPYPPPRQADSHVTARGPVPYPDASSTSRGHRVILSREQELDRGGRNPPSRSRYDDIRPEDAMDVDYPSQTSRSGSSRGDQPRLRGNDRPSLDLQMDTLPKGPRAMSKAHGSLSHTPSPSPVLPSIPIRMPEPSSARPQRAPPPHMRQDAPPASRGHPSSALPSGPRVDYSDNDRRPSRFNDSVGSKEPLARPGRRDGDPAIAGPKLSGTNNIPIGPKRPSSGPPSSEPPFHSPMLDRGPTKYAPDVFKAPPPHSSYMPESDPAYDDRQTDARTRRTSVSSRGNSAGVPPSPQFNMPPPNSLPLRPRDELPAGPEHRSGRQTRFGPESSAKEPERIWLTREESMSRGSVQDTASSRGARGSDGGREDPPARYEVVDRRRRGHDDLPPRHLPFVEPFSAARGRSQNAVDEFSSRGRPTTLEGRPSMDHRLSSYEPPPDMRGPPDTRGREYGRDPAYYESGSWKDPAGWGARADMDSSRIPVHPERAHVADSPFPPPPGDETLLPGTNSGGSRSRGDRGPDRAGPATYEDTDYSHDTNPESGVERSPPVRYLSLLERIRLDNPDAGRPTLRDRVEAPAKRVLPDFSGLPPRPSAETTHDAEMNAALEGGTRGRNKKRKQRGKRV